MFLNYALSISISNFDKICQKIKMILIICMMVCSLIIFCLPLNISSGDAIYSSGPAVSMVYIISSIAILIALIFMIKDLKNLKNKKYVPLFIFIIGLGLVAIIQKIEPSFTLITTLESFV